MNGNATTNETLTAPGEPPAVIERAEDIGVKASSTHAPTPATDDDAVVRLEVWVAQATQAMHDADWIAAMEGWARVRQMAPADARGYREGAVALRNAARFDESDAVAEAGYRHVGPHADFLILRADTAMDQRMWALAAERWARMRDAFPDQERAYTGGTTALRLAARHDEAEQVADAGLARFGACEPFLLARAEAAVARGDRAEAAARWEVLRQAFPDNATAYHDGIVALRNVGRFDEADQVADAALARFGPEKRLWMLRAHTAVDRGDWAGAAQAYRDALDAFPDDVDLAVNLADALRFAGRPDDAWRVTKTALDTHGRTPELVYLGAILAAGRLDGEMAQAWHDELFGRLEAQPYEIAVVDPGPLRLALSDLSTMVGRLASERPQHDYARHDDAAPVSPNRAPGPRTFTEAGARLAKILVTSVPKAGTHLMSTLLDQAGFRFNGLFVNQNDCVLEIDDSFGGNRVYEFVQAPGFPAKFINQLNIDAHTAFALLRAGEHCLCHFPPKVMPGDWIERLKTIALFRNPKSTLRSEFVAEMKLYTGARPYMYSNELEYIFRRDLPAHTKFEAWLMAYGRTRAELYRDMVGWARADHAICVRYENLLGPQAEDEVKRLFDFIAPDSSRYAPDLLRRVLAMDNPTRRVGEPLHIWSEVALRLYDEFGFAQIRQALDDVAPVRA